MACVNGRKLIEGRRKYYIAGGVVFLAVFFTILGLSVELHKRKKCGCDGSGTSTGITTVTPTGIITVTPTGNTTGTPPETTTRKSEIIPEERIPCPLPTAVELSKDSCAQYSCIWEEQNTGSTIPQCYSARDDFGYTQIDSDDDLKNQLYSLKYDGKTNSPFYENVINYVDVKVTFLDQNILRIQITDTNNTRYEVPVQKDFNLHRSSAGDNAYEFDTTITENSHFTFQVTRSKNGTKLFDTSIGNLIMTKNFLQISTRVPSKNLYGFGENTHDSLKHNFNHDTWPMFARDAAPGDGFLNLYGVHPFYECVEDDGKAHGVLLLNSNAMEYTLLPAPGITFTTIGGVLDFFIFVGESPEHVTQLYHQVIGKTFLPPYWALGFHLSRYGYNNLTNLRNAIDRTKAAGVPQDVQHLDIDYMTRYLDFTFDSVRFQGLPDFIKEKQEEGLKFITMLDPAVIANATDGPDPYPDVFKDGVDKNVFIQWSPDIKTDNRSRPDNVNNSDVMFGQVWPPGPVAFPDFFKNSTKAWWTTHLKFLRDTNNITFDAIWIDMNEPSDFSTENGIDTLCGTKRPDPNCWSLQCPVNEYDNPEYLTKAAADGGSLRHRTICMAAVQGEKNEFSHYDVHSLYGHMEGVVTYQVAQELTGKRSLVLSRSTYPSSGRYMGHWLGDNTSRWKDLKRSIIGMLEFNIFGIPFVGADICGFFGDTTDEMCVRWTQLGAFYPFSRNHNSLDAKDQDPGAFTGTSLEAIREAIVNRYKLLPYLYTLFYYSNTNGGTVARPLFHEFPTDKNTLDIDTQFMWGPSLLVSPILNEGQKQLEYYVPNGTWYDFYTCTDMESAGENKTLDNIKLETKIPLLVREGSIIPIQELELNTQNRSKTFIDLFTCPLKGEGKGELFWDDGDSIDTVGKNEYSLYSFTLSNCLLNVTNNQISAKSSSITVGNIILCTKKPPTEVKVNDVLVANATTVEGMKVIMKVNKETDNGYLKVEWLRDGKCDM